MASPSTPAKSQYHHFIPRFILRNFAHPFRPPKNPPKGSAKRDKRRQKGGYQPGEPMLHAIHLAGAAAEVTETSVSRTFGFTDMYRDFANASNQHHLEEQLSRLESRAGEIVSKIRKAFDAGNQEVWITRTDRDILRKFLFIMKYRGSSARKRFYHQRIEDYSANDRESLLQYMREKGYQKPVDVWFDNIRAMLELKMDPKLEWMEELKKRAYPADAEWFIKHTQMMYLALCTPSHQDDEFLLTENAYSIQEGPVSLTVDPVTGESVMTCYTEFHVFATISPKLMIVLRSNLLPQPVEDINDDERYMKETLYELNAFQHNNPDTANSILEDLPIAKAHNSYSRIVDGRAIRIEGEDWTPRAYHKFCFRFFPISTSHVNKINCIMLEESYAISTIVFKSHLGARRALEYYLGMSCEHNFKTVSDAPDDLRFAFLKKLEQVVKQLGSGTIAVYQVRKSWMEEEDIFEELGQRLAKALPNEPTETMKLYMKLGGSAMLMPKDMEQARRMLNMRIKIDVWSKGLNESIREEIREHLRDLFCQLPARRVWYYLKHIRHMRLGENVRRSTPLRANGRNEPGASRPELMGGPEDAIVDASHLIRANDLCRLMYHATLNHIFVTLNPDCGLMGESTPDVDQVGRLWKAKTFVFGPSGSICDCGISELEEQARVYRDTARMTRFYKDYVIPVWTDEQNVEMATRVLIRDDFSTILGNSVSRPGLEALKGVFFGFVYPSLGSH